MLCDLIDTIEHHLFECHTSKKLWNQLEKWLIQTLEIKHTFTICEIIFGIICTLKDKNILNFTILLTKWYINNTKTNDNELFLLDLLTVIRQKLQISLQNIKLIGDYENENNWQQLLFNVL